MPQVLIRMGLPCRLASFCLVGRFVLRPFALEKLRL